MTTSLNRTSILRLTNKSGAAVDYGDVIVLGTATASAFTTTATAALTAGMMGVVLEPGGIANNAIGMIAVAGYVPQINLTNTASLYYTIGTSSTTGSGVAHSVRIAGDFAIALTASATPEAYLWGSPIQVAAIAAPPQARYTNGAGSTIPTSAETVINFLTKVYDVSSLVTVGASWKFTALVSGLYQVNAQVQLSSNDNWAAPRSASLWLRKNGTQYSLLDYHAAYTNSSPNALYVALGGSDVIPLSAGDYLDTTLTQDSTATIALRPLAGYNHIAITKIGEIAT